MSTAADVATSSRKIAELMAAQATADHLARREPLRYQYQNLNTDGTPIATGDLPAGGTTGPGGCSFLYVHFQFDA